MIQTTAVLALVLLCWSSSASATEETTKQIVRSGPDLGLPFSPAVKAGGFIYLSGALAVDDQLRVSGDIKAQTRRILDDLAGTLKAAGSRLENVATVFVYLKNASDFQAMNEAYREYWPKDPPARTTVVADLVLPNALIEISMVAIADGGERTVVHPAGWAPSPNPYSYGIKSGNTLFLAGLVARSPRDGSIVEGDVATQTRVALDNAGEILKAAGMTHADVVGARVFLTDASTFEEMNAAYRPYFPRDPPARATVKVSLNNPRFRVEITLAAVKDPSRRAITIPDPDGSPGQPNPNFSSAIQVGDRLYLAGMLGLTDGTRGDTKAQTREALARLGRTLKAAGFDWPHVVDSIVYLTDLSKFGAMNEAYREVLTRDFPARTTVGTGLVVPDGLVEIMLMAVK